eukprot:scaffold11_cov257-Pinguiococcus_pyrenoidosus.AAC.34
MELMSIDFMETSDEKEEKRRKLLEVLRRRELPRGVMLLLLRVARALQREVRGAAAGMSSDRVEQAYEFLKSLLERHENSKEQSRLEKRFFAACHHRRELLSSRIGSQPGQDGDPARDSIIDEALRDKVDLVLFWYARRPLSSQICLASNSPSQASAHPLARWGPGRRAREVRRFHHRRLRGHARFRRPVWCASRQSPFRPGACRDPQGGGGPREMSSVHCERGRRNCSG